jgi:predicted dehydrogenase
MHKTSYKAKIIGAGSIGNHLTHACRSRNWDVTLCDIDEEALNRSKNLIYPQRYGIWDESIRLNVLTNHDGQEYDAVFIGTPPDSHIQIAIQQIELEVAKTVVIEKPLCPPNMAGLRDLLEISKQTNTRVLVAYNHRLTRATQFARKLFEENDFGKVLSIRALTRESWDGIMRAHPWLNSPQDSYLSSIEHGGGALLEHSHALNLFQYFSFLTGAGNVESVSAVQDLVTLENRTYDQISQLSLRTSSGCLGLVEQDVVSMPSMKSIRVDAVKATIEVSMSAAHDTVSFYPKNGESKIFEIPKTRPDDFLPEIEHIEEIISNPERDSPLDIKFAVDTMRVIVAAMASSSFKSEVTIRDIN